MEYTWTKTTTAPLKVKRFLIDCGLSHRLISAMKKGAGQFLVNGKLATTATELKQGDQVTVRLDAEPADPAVAVSTAPLNILFEDQNWLVVDKPAGLTTIPGPTNSTDTLVNRVKGHLLAEQADDLRPHIILRLDRFTSGVVLIAKNRLAQSLIAPAVEGHQLDKRYIAIASGRVTPQHGNFTGPIGRVGTTPQREVRADGKPAHTEYWCRETTDKWTLADVKLYTGRTHQIRVHFAVAGHPLLGDELYGGPMDLIQRQALHASFLKFSDPFTHEKLTFEAPLPADMQHVLQLK
ncbi:hypothetical protein IV38_GL001445 [Lactobacillus selangorensis]|uniref:Pseudouridine synthase n=1 Tax=Lactobacillus selangorensis TaxID=81857 RepID=A0A0R2G3T1_9LACO|nr:RluA family pseudouridine synthase [Lactobacillus selangorensis]KRN28445.1 hypothetical protein IV38_GL001445 [Lactobacillus selangorensis]KRN31946.1 hypothetical protein IV40_GL001232 [Lactobacillus selangorensis]